jgi:GcrA cell cycle regulator
MPAANSPWTDERCEVLRVLWAGGLPASDIAKQLGTTRSGVLGKVMRLQLTPRRSTEFKPGPPGHSRGQAPRPPRPTPRKRPVSPQIPQTPQIPQIRHMRRLQLVQLTERHCRWPIGDPHRHPFYFCAADRQRGDPYCAFHMAKAFVKPRR